MSLKHDEIRILKYVAEHGLRSKVYEIGKKETSPGAEFFYIDTEHLEVDASEIFPDLSLPEGLLLCKIRSLKGDGYLRDVAISANHDSSECVIEWTLTESGKEVSSGPKRQGKK